MVKILEYRPVSEKYVTAKFDVELDKATIAKITRLILSNWALLEKDGKIWVNPPSSLDPTDPEKRRYKPLLSLNDQLMSEIAVKVKEAVIALKNSTGNESNDMDGLPF